MKLEHISDLPEKVKQAAEQAALVASPLFHTFGWTWVDGKLNGVPSYYDLEQRFLRLALNVAFDEGLSESGRLCCSRTIGGEDEDEYLFFVKVSAADVYPNERGYVGATTED